MFKHFIFCTMLLAALPLSVHAGHGTIRETDTEIIVEYSGADDPEVKAIRIGNERAERQEPVDAARRQLRIEQSLERAKIKDAIRAEKPPRVRGDEGE